VELLTPAHGDDEVWYVVRGKPSRRPRRIARPRGARQPNPVESASEAAGSERTEAKARGKSAQRGREGTGEGPGAEPGGQALITSPATW